MGCRTRGTVGDALLLERLLCVLLLELAAGPLGTEPVPFLTTGVAANFLTLLVATGGCKLHHPVASGIVNAEALWHSIHGLDHSAGLVFVLDAPLVRLVLDLSGDRTLPEVSKACRGQGSHTGPIFGAMVSTTGT